MTDYRELKRLAEEMVEASPFLHHEGQIDRASRGAEIITLLAENARSTEREILQLAEIEALRKDAERYRWLREKGGATFSFGSGKRCVENWYEIALDHAMANEK